MAKRPKENNEWKIWALIIGLFVIGLWPVALGILVYKLMKDQKRIPAEKTRGTDELDMVEQAARETYRAQGSKKYLSLGLKILGGFLALSGLINAGAAIDALFWSSDWVSLWAEDLIWALAVAGVGGFLFSRGISMERTTKRYSRYLAVMGDRDAIAVEELSRVLDYPAERVEKDLRKMIDKGYFGGRAYLDMEKGFLFRSSEAAERMAAEEKQAEDCRRAAQDRTEESEYDRILRQIHQVNEDIADPALSEKIQRLEDITARIFRLVEAEPQKRGRISRLLDYYLPTTQKLLDSYARFEAAGVEGENLRQAKLRIEKTMDSIVAGFEHQLDQMYKDEAMDVDSDIRVMETMLNRDAASVERDFGLGGSAYE